MSLVDDLKALSDNDAAELPDAWYRRTYGQEPGYSAVLQALARSPAERRNLLQPFFEPSADERDRGLKVPMSAHRAIAALVASGHVRVIVTTNFDRLMELALLELGITAVVISNGDQALGAAPLVHQRCVIIKLHGDYLDDRVMNTDAELATYDEPMTRLLGQVLDEFGLIVSGWSGEWDAALRSAIERCPNRRYTTYWSLIGEPGPLAAGLIARRQAQVIRTASADALFADLEGKVAALDDMWTAPPLSVDAAAATVKRFIAEDRFRIRLEDLVCGEALKVAEAIDSGLPLLQPPTPELMVATLRSIDGQSAILRSLFLEGCRWARNEHMDVFARALSLMPPRSMNVQTTYDVWTLLRFYPMCLVLYAGAFGAICSRN